MESSQESAKPPGDIDENIDTAKLDEHLLKNGIKANPAYDGIYRFVTHNDVSREDLALAVDILKRFPA